MDRRQFLAAGLLTGLAGCTGTTDRMATDSPTGSATPAADGTPATGSPTDTGTAALPDAVSLEPVAAGLDRPLDLASVPDSELRYVAQQGGEIAAFDGDGVRSEPLLDLTERISTGAEKGLLGIALHPEFAANRRLFVRYSAPARESTPDGYSHTFVLSEFRVGDDGRRVEADSEREILTIAQPQRNHNAGSIVFGPDGYLYVGVGDGGAGGDQGRGHADDWYDAVDGGNGQDVTENLLGSILRIDVDGRSDGNPYAIPDDNPLVGREGLDEQYAWGFRNPYRMAFDGADLLVGDVGQNRFEEVDLVEKGGNYGWNVREATHCYDADDCPDRTPDDVRGGEPLLDPVIEYPHSGGAVSGISVIGGQVYRGSSIPALGGAYLFGDLQVKGRLFAARPTDSGQWPTRPVELPDANTLQRLLSVGRDADGELDALGTGADGGGVHRVVAAE
jgi:glucose/arabinose dehydrogenase